MLKEDKKKMETGGGSADDRRGAFRVGETKSKERNKREWEEDEGVNRRGDLTPEAEGWKRGRRNSGEIAEREG